MVNYNSKIIIKLIVFISKPAKFIIILINRIEVEKGNLKMKFKQFLVEVGKSYINQSDIIYHSILDNLDHGHIDMGDDTVKFNVGKIIKNSAYDNLNVLLKKSKVDDVRLGTHKESGIPTIVVLTAAQLPKERTNVDKFLENPELAKKIKKVIQNYLEIHHDTSKEKEADSASSYEKPKLYATKFEEHYKTLINDIKRMMKDYTDAKRYLIAKAGTTGNEAKRSITQSAIKASYNQHFGESFKEFLSKLKGVEGSKFLDHIPKELKEKALARLESFYDQEIAPLKNADSE